MTTPKQALEGLIEAVTRDADEPGGRGISGYTSARLSDAKAALASLEGDAVERVARIKSLLASFHRNSCYPEAMTGELNDAAACILASGFVQDEAGSVATWMIQHGYVTGHGDTLDDLLRELVASEREKCAEDSNGVDPKLLEGKSELFVSIYCQARVDAAAAIRSGGGE